MKAWQTSSWPVRCIVLAMVAYVVIAPTVVLKGYLGDNVREGFLLVMGVGKACR